MPELLEALMNQIPWEIWRYGDILLLHTYRHSREMGR